MGKVVPFEQRRGERKEPSARREAMAQKEQSMKETRRGERKQKQQDAKTERKLRYPNTIDYPLLVILVVLICFGLLMVYSSSYYMAEMNNKESQYYFLKQLTCVVIGTAFLLFFTLFDYHHFISFPWNKKAKGRGIAAVRPYWLVLLFGLLCLLLVYSPIGVDLNGSRRWINILGISIQPSEIMKMALIIFLSCSIGRAPRRIRSFKDGLLPYLLLIAVVCFIIYKQPNFSAVVCIVTLVMCILTVGGAKLSHIGLILLGGVLVLALLVGLASYRTHRLNALIDPMSDWQLQQSLYSFGAGGAFGRGLGNSMQKLLYLPYRESDFIFAIIAEELGFVGCILVLAAFGLLIWRGISIAMRAPDLTGMLLVTGAVSMISIQVIVNIGVNVGLLPPTGVVLPFISYGGSGILIFMSLVGIILNVSRQTMPVIHTKKGEAEAGAQEEEPKRERRRRKREKTGRNEIG